MVNLHFDIIDMIMMFAAGFMYSAFQTQRKAQQSLAVAPDRLLLALRLITIVILVLIIIYRAITGNRA